MGQQKLKEIRDYRTNPRSAHEPPDPNHRNDVSFSEEDYRDNPTKQSDAEASDINNIMRKYEQTGYVPEGRGQMMDGDFTSYDFRSAMDIIAQGKSMFHGLPAQIRAEFKNDPARFLEFTDRRHTDPAVGKRLVDLGLAELLPTKTETSEEVLKSLRDEVRNQNAKGDKTKPKASSGASSDE